MLGRQPLARDTDGSRVKPSLHVRSFILVGDHVGEELGHDTYRCWVLTARLGCWRSAGLHGCRTVALVEAWQWLWRVGNRT